MWQPCPPAGAGVTSFVYLVRPCFQRSWTSHWSGRLRNGAQQVVARLEQASQVASAPVVSVLCGIQLPSIASPFLSHPVIHHTSITSYHIISLWPDADIGPNIPDLPEVWWVACRAQHLDRSWMYGTKYGTKMYVFCIFLYGQICQQFLRCGQNDPFAFESFWAAWPPERCSQGAVQRLGQCVCKQWAVAWVTSCLQWGQKQMSSDSRALPIRN